MDIVDWNQLKVFGMKLCSSSSSGGGGSSSGGGSSGGGSSGGGSGCGGRGSVRDKRLEEKFTAELEILLKFGFGLGKKML